LSPHREILNKGSLRAGMIPAHEGKRRCRQDLDRKSAPQPERAAGAKRVWEVSQMRSVRGRVNGKGGSMILPGFAANRLRLAAI